MTDFDAAYCVNGPSHRSTARADTVHATADGKQTLCGAAVSGVIRDTPFAPTSAYACKRCIKAAATKPGKPAQHTPEPWTLYRDRVMAADERHGGATIIATIYRHTPGQSDHVAPDVIQDANARLIIAAPDLLATARKFLAFYDDLSKSNPGFMAKLCLQDYARWNEAMLDLPAAIRKATPA